MFGKLKRMASSLFGGNKKSTRRGRSTRPRNRTRTRTTARNRRTPARSYRRR